MKVIKKLMIPTNVIQPRKESEKNYAVMTDSLRIIQNYSTLLLFKSSRSLISVMMKSTQQIIPRLSFNQKYYVQELQGVFERHT